jgi:hypothetical protein
MNLQIQLRQTYYKQEEITTEQENNVINQLDKLRQEIEALKKQIVAKEAELATNHASQVLVKKLRGELEELKAKLTEKEQEVDTLKAQIVVIQKNLRKEIESKKSDLEQKIETYATEKFKKSNNLFGLGNALKKPYDKEKIKTKLEAFLETQRVIVLSEEVHDVSLLIKQKNEIKKKLIEKTTLTTEEVDSLCSLKKKIVNLEQQLKSNQKLETVINNYYSGTFNAPVFGGDITTGNNANFGTIETQHNYPSEAKIQQNTPPVPPHN